MPKTLGTALCLLVLLATGVIVQGQESGAKLTENDKELIRSATRKHKLPEGIEKMPIRRHGMAIEINGETRMFFGVGEKTGADDEVSGEGFDFRKGLRDFLIESLYLVATRPDDNIDPNFQSNGFPTERNMDLHMILHELINGQRLIDDETQIEFLEFLHSLPPHREIILQELAVIHKILREESTNIADVYLIQMALEVLKDAPVENGGGKVIYLMSGGMMGSYTSGILSRGQNILDKIVLKAKKDQLFVPYAHTFLALLEAKGLEIRGKEHLGVGN